VEARLAGDLKMLITPNKSRVKALLDNTMMNHATVKDDEILHLKQSWELAESRLDHHNTKTKLAKSWERLAKSLLLRAKPQPVLPHVRAAKKRMLFATIRGFYLQAMARLPADELRARYHRSMLKAGHCYGPLDPVSNIIVNTIWYDQAAFSQSKPCTLQMISTKCLMRIVARSFYGLLSFLCTRYPDCSPDQAMGWLQMANADLRIVDPALGYMSNKITRTDNISMSFCCNLPLQVGIGCLCFRAEASRRSVTRLPVSTKLMLLRLLLLSTQRRLRSKSFSHHLTTWLSLGLYICMRCSTVTGSALTMSP
jgi:hypothetical protein